MTLGILDGALVGAADGLLEGATDGINDGTSVISTDGTIVGILDGFNVVVKVGTIDGTTVITGTKVGTAFDSIVGIIDEPDGLTEGHVDSGIEESIEGAKVAVTDGEGKKDGARVEGTAVETLGWLDEEFDGVTEGDTEGDTEGV